MLARGLLKLSPAQIDQLSKSSIIGLPVEMMPAAKPKEPIPPDGWIDPIDAVHWLAPHVGGDANAKLAIAERLRDGAIGCSVTWMSMGPDIGPFSNRRPNFPTMGPDAKLGPWASAVNSGGNPIMIGRAFWNFSDNWDADLKRWNWRAGLFVASCEDKTLIFADGVPLGEESDGSRRRMVVSGIRFSHRDIAKMVGIEGSSVLALSHATSGQKKAEEGGARGRTGPRLKKHLWVKILSQLESEILTDGINKFGDPFVGGTQAQLEKYIQDQFSEISDRIPSESTVRRKVQPVMSHWREHLLNKSHDAD